LFFIRISKISADFRVNNQEPGKRSAQHDEHVTPDLKMLRGAVNCMYFRKSGALYPDAVLSDISCPDIAKYPNMDFSNSLIRINFFIFHRNLSFRNRQISGVLSFSQ